MDIITDLLNLPQESTLDVFSRIENDILIIQLTLKPFPAIARFVVHLLHA